jgi:hypothetical protein
MLYAGWVFLDSAPCSSLILQAAALITVHYLFAAGAAAVAPLRSSPYILPAHNSTSPYSALSTLLLLLHR